jgi:uncharacterized protein (DUF2235 family)
MKRLIVCCDGTWQKNSSPYPSNVAKFLQAVKTSDTTIVFYGEGVGTGTIGVADRILGGALGWGIDQNIQDAYRFLCLNYTPGDQIYLLGFSRGAYTVRSLVGLIRAAGILPPYGIRQIPNAYRAYQEAKGKFADQSDQQRQAVRLRETEPLQNLRKALVQQFGADYQVREEAEITFLGCWDTVGALGIPDQIPWLPLDDILNRKYQFHNTRLSSKIRHARHAVAIDEDRKAFDYTRMEPAQTDQGAVLNPDQVKQVWFPGSHGCIGGGTKVNSPLSNAAFLWMIDEIKDLKLGLEFDLDKVEDGVATDARIHRIREDQLLPPHPRNIPTEPSPTFHPSAQQRWLACPWDYRPKILSQFPKLFDPSPTPDPAPAKTLAIGETAQFCVMANEAHNSASVKVEEGATYQITVHPGQIWQDDKIVCTAAGWRVVEPTNDNDSWKIDALEAPDIDFILGKLYQLAKHLRRVPEANWMQLIVEVEGHPTPIGLDNTFTAPASGLLTAYANDAHGFYHNNRGWIFASITRKT